jgi:hypothetical protein
LSAEAAEHIFALGFVLEQLHQNLWDLSRCIADYAHPEGEGGEKGAARDALASK